MFEDVYAVTMGSGNMWVTENLIKWWLEKQVVEKIGKSM